MTLIQNPGKPDFNRIAFALAVIVVAVLVALGKLPANAFTALLAGSGLGAWLLPSPLKPTKPAQADGHDEGVDNSPEEGA